MDLSTVLSTKFASAEQAYDAYVDACESREQDEAEALAE